MRRNLGDEVFERLIEPFCSGKSHQSLSLTFLFFFSFLSCILFLLAFLTNLLLFVDRDFYIVLDPIIYSSWLIKCNPSR